MQAVPITPTHQASRPGTRDYLLIQALRFIAALGVVCAHSTFYTIERLDPAVTLYQAGTHGVILFFVISGFVMVESSESLIGRPGAAAVFAMKRIVRIVPLYWTILTIKLVMMLASPAMVLHANLDWSYVLKSYFFIPAWNKDGVVQPFLGVGWTLNFEMFFYALFALSLALRVGAVAFLGPILIGLSALSLIRQPIWPTPLYFYSDMYTLGFLAGMLVGRWTQGGHRLGSVMSWLFLALGLAILFLPLPLSGPIGRVILTVAASGVLMAAVSLETTYGGKTPRLILYLGAASYSLYLIHPLIAPAAPVVLNKLHIVIAPFAILGSVVAALIAGATSFRFVETPLTRLVSRPARAFGLLNVASSQVSDREYVAQDLAAR